MKNSELVKDYLLKYYDSELLSENNGLCLFTIRINNKLNFLSNFFNTVKLAGIKTNYTDYSHYSNVIISMANEENLLIWRDDFEQVDMQSV